MQRPLSLKREPISSPPHRQPEPTFSLPIEGGMAVSVTDAVIIINDLIYHLMLFTLSSSDDSSVKSVVLVSTMNEMLSYEPLHSIFTSL